MRPVVQWYGGKARLARWIVASLPASRIYVEPFAGAASVFFSLPRRPVEVLNDLDDRIITVYRVLQDPAAYAELRHRLEWTPYARAEFRRALQVLATPEAHDLVTRAWALVVAQQQGFSGATPTTVGHWGRGRVAKRPWAWARYATRLDAWHARLQGVFLEAVDGVACWRAWDSPETCAYVDPPYHPDTRTKGRVYRHELDAEGHERLLAALCEARGMVVLSAYPHPRYDERLLASGWTRRTRPSVASTANRRGVAARRTTEVLWLNPAAQRALASSGRLER